MKELRDTLLYRALMIAYGAEDITWDAAEYDEPLAHTMALGLTDCKVELTTDGKRVLKALDEASA